MKVITWNINRNNVLTHEKLEFISGLNSDILLLQEVSDNNLDLLKSYLYEYYCYSATETLISFGKEKHYFLSTFIKKTSIKQIISTEKIKLPTYQPLLYKIFNRKIRIEFLKTTVKFDNNSLLDIVNCHLQYATSPSNRLEQFSVIRKSINNQNYIIAGDLNTFSSFVISCFLGFWLDYSIYDFLKKESDLFIKENNDLNLGSSRCQTSIYRSGKLDWICSSPAIIFSSEKILSNNQKSDHFPVMADLSFTNGI